MFDKLEVAINNLPEKIKKMYLVWIPQWVKLIKREGQVDYTKYPRYKRGEVILINFAKNLGAQFSGRHYGVIIRTIPVTDGNVTVIPLTSYKGKVNKKFNVKLGDVINNGKDTVAKVEQITTISKINIINKSVITKLDIDSLDKIDNKIKELYIKQ